MPISKPLLYLCLATPAFASTTSAFAHEDRVFEMAEPTERSTRDVIGRYPSWADKEKASAGAILSIVVSPAGKIHRCTITSYVGVAKLATQICNYAQSLRFSPARNIDGDAVHAGLMLKMTYSHRQGADTQAVEEMREPTEIELKVSSIDLLEDDQREFSIDALYDETGFVEACRGEPEIPSFLADAACDIVEEDEAKPLPIEGGNVQYVRRFKVRVAGQG